MVREVAEVNVVKSPCWGPRVDVDVEGGNEGLGFCPTIVP